MIKIARLFSYPFVPLYLGIYPGDELSLKVGRCRCPYRVENKHADHLTAITAQKEEITLWFEFKFEVFDISQLVSRLYSTIQEKGSAGSVFEKDREVDNLLLRCPMVCIVASVIRKKSLNV